MASLHPFPRRRKRIAALACLGIAAAASFAWARNDTGRQSRFESTPPFQVTIALSNQAAARLDRDHETIMVVAYYFGSANRRGARIADDMGEIGWARDDRVELKGAGTATFGGRGVRARLLNYFEGRAPKVLINVFSGRRTNRNNLLNCGIFVDSVYVAAKDGIRISCDMIRPEGEASLSAPANPRKN